MTGRTTGEQVGRENEVTATGNRSRRREVESQGEKFWNIWWSVELRGRTERGLETRAGGREEGGGRGADCDTYIERHSLSY